MTPEQATALKQLAADFSRGDDAIVDRVAAAIRNPPRTTEAVGYYVSACNNDFENCFRHLVSLLEPYATSAEDKYVYEIFPQWIGADRLLKQAPAELAEAFPEFLAPKASNCSTPARDDVTARLRRHYVAGVRALEVAFDATGFPLLSLDTGEGDTLVFINVERSIADRWRGTVLGHTHEGGELGVRAPMWGAFWSHVAYAFGLELGEPPPGLP